MDTALYAYTPVNLPFETLAKEAMKRAVRVKQSIGKKISENFTVPGIDSKISEVVAEKQKLEETLAPNTELTEGTFLVSKSVDETKENIAKLDQKLKSLESRRDLVKVSNRAVLYTKALVAKVQNVTNKWFSVLQNAVKNGVIAAKQEDVVIPDTWDMAFGQSLETPTPTVSPTPTEKPEPIVTPMPSVTPVEVPEIPLTPVPEATKSNGQDFGIPTSWTPDVKAPKPEPEPVDNVIPWDFGKKTIPTVESVPSINMDEVKEPSNVESKKIIPWDFGNPTAKKEVGIEMVAEGPKDDMPTLTAIFAKVQRAVNAIKERDTRIAELEGKNDTLATQLKSANERNASYETVVKDSVNANSRLAAENTQLKEKATRLEASIQSVVVSSRETQIAQERKHAEEIARLNEEKEVAVAKLVAEIEELKQQHTEELREKDRASKNELKSISDIIKGLSDASVSMPKSYQSTENDGYAKAA
jgi:hypothetical protein